MSEQSKNDVPMLKSNSVNWIALALITVLALAVFCYHLGDFVLLSEHEALVGQTAKETLSGHWIVPYMDGQMRLEKTPLVYWIVAGISSMRNGIVDEFSTRIPSAISAVVIVILMMIFASQAFDRKTGILTGLATVASVGMLWQSHRGTSDMLMSVFVVACFVFFWFGLERIKSEQSGKLYFYLFYICFSLGMLAKGPVPAPAVGLPIAIYLLCTGDWRYWKKFHLIAGVIITAVMLGWWVLGVLISVPDAIWRWKAEYIMRYLGGFGTMRPWYYYIPQIFLLTLPWSVFLPAGLWVMWKSAAKHSRDIPKSQNLQAILYVALWLIVDFIFFSISKGKRAHYILPILPPAILVSVLGMMASKDRLLAEGKKFQKVIKISTVAIVVVILAIGWWYVHSNFQQIETKFIVVAIITVLSAIVFTTLYMRGSLIAASSILSITLGLTFSTYIWPLVPQAMNSERNPKIAAEKVHNAVPPDAKFYFIGRCDSPLVFYYDKIIPQIPNAEQVIELLKNKKKKNAAENIKRLTIKHIAKLVSQNGCCYFITADGRYNRNKPLFSEYNINPSTVLRLTNFHGIGKSLILIRACRPTTTTSQPTTQPRPSDK